LNELPCAYSLSSLKEEPFGVSVRVALAESAPVVGRYELGSTERLPADNESGVAWPHSWAKLTAVRVEE